MIIVNSLVNIGQRMEQEKNTQMLMKDNGEKTVHSFFHEANYKRAIRFTGK